jgi:GR25 family glycosyltransferase involved in LPS biosynthesis
MDALLEKALEQGLGYALFVALFIYVLKTTGERERNYQTIIKELTEKFGIMDAINTKVEKIENKIESIFINKREM